MSVATLPPKSSTTDRIVTNMAQSLQRCEVSDAPFSHLYVRDIFPRDIYDAMLDSLPDPAAYEPQVGKQLPDGTYPRLFYKLDGQGLGQFSGEQRNLWEAVVDAVLSEEFKVQVFRQLRKDLSARFGRMDVEAIEASPWPRLCRDTAGYRIAPHPDTRKKAVTMMIYLPRDESQRDLGTSLYKFRPGLRALKSKDGWFKEVKRFPFLPNSGFAFAVSNSWRKKSWHGRERLREGAGVRNSLVTTFYLPGTVEYERD